MKHLILIPIIAGLAGCAGINGFNQSQYASGLRPQRVQFGIVISDTPARTSGHGQIGGLIGAVAGGGIAHAAGGRTLGSMLGALAGGLLGDKIGRDATARAAWIITIRLRSGQSLAVTQNHDLPVGSCAQLVSGRHARLFAAPATACKVTVSPRTNIGGVQ